MQKLFEEKQKETPLMSQYNRFKATHPDAILLFRVGDFYETFGQDAIITAKILDIILTKRANGSAAYVELAGFPHHALDNYLPRLVRAGYRVAICDQLEDPKFAKGIVKRGVTELITPGVVFHDNVLDVKRNNYLASIYIQKEKIGVAFLDISTGEFLTAAGTPSYIEKLMQGFQPSEVIFSKQFTYDFEAIFKDNYNTYKIDDWICTFSYCYEKLTKHFGTTSLKGFGIEEMPEAIIAAGSILYYLESTEHRHTSHIASIARIEEDQYVWLDKFTIRNLELIYPQHEGGVPFIEVIDATKTPMGARLLKKWVLLPLKNLQAIQERLEVVSFLLAEEELRHLLTEALAQIGDLERLISKVAVGRVTPREMVQLKKAIRQLKPIKEALLHTSAPQVKRLADRINPCEELMQNIENVLEDNAPVNVHTGNFIRKGVNTELDELREIAFSGKDFLMKIQEKEAQRTGIPSLKISYNNVFGYYLEVRNTHQDKVPKDWIRKQTLANAERYVTEELKVYEEKILTAESSIGQIEERIFQNLVSQAMEYVQPIQQNAQAVATLDCLLSFATIAQANKYVKPEVNDDYLLYIKDGRHPVIEKQLPFGEAYIPNDIRLDENQQIIIITGPNMAGKSALLRQTALTVLMAQIGCFVAASSAIIGITDKIFTRVGASDNLSKGESTFMVEMTETASILNNLSHRSLVLMDEIGRGTSTYDGISIAWAIVEHIHNHPTHKAKTLFATHYHELNQLADDLKNVKNFNVSVKELNDKIIFTRKLVEGGSEHSFGIHVAQLAGIPNTVVIRAYEVLEELEKEKASKTKRKLKAAQPVKPSLQTNIFDTTDSRLKAVAELIKKTDINTLSPVEALLRLNELKNMLA